LTLDKVASKELQLLMDGAADTDVADGKFFDKTSGKINPTWLKKGVLVTPTTPLAALGSK